MATVKGAGKRRHGTGSVQERSPGHWRLRAYNPGTRLNIVAAGQRQVPSSRFA
jgi:hypothetical protein